MKKNKFGLTGVILVVAGTVWAAGEIFNDQSEATLKIERQDTGLQVQSKEVRYITNYLGDYSRQMLLKVITTLNFNTGQEGGEGDSVIEARSEKDFYATPVWTVTDQGQEVSYLNDYLIKSVRFGCCGDFIRSTLYNV